MSDPQTAPQTNENPRPPVTAAATFLDASARTQGAPRTPKRAPRVKMVMEGVVLPPDARIDVLSAVEQRFFLLSRQFCEMGRQLQSIAEAVSTMDSDALKHRFMDVLQVQQMMTQALTEMSEEMGKIRDGQ